MIELYQAEWCPHSHRVRQRLTELGQHFAARQVEADPAARNAMRAAVGSDSIPLLLAEDGTTYAGEETILAYLDRTFHETPDAERHRQNDRDEGPAWRPCA